MSSEEKKAEIFNTLSQVDVSSYVKEKNGLSYLAWTFAWAEVKKRYPDATYKVWKDENHRPYIHDPDLGYMCFTSVTIQGETEEMWLPVMDGANKAQKNKPYTYKVTDWEETNAKRRTEEKAGMDPRKAKKIVLLKDKSVDAATMFDINTTVMRCFVKNLAMFGMGHYIYAGESIPESLINVDELIEDASVALKACTDGESVVALWSENKAIQKEDKFLTIYIAAAGSILDKCTTATSLPKA